MKVLAIIGSPRKAGNTFNVVEEVKAHLLEQDCGIDFEYLFLGDMNLKMCTGCFACIARGAGLCPLKDDRALIEQKMQEADGILFAAPTYVKGVPALMKNFIDRFAYTCHRPMFFDKALLAVTTVGGIMGMKEALSQLSVLAGGGKYMGRLGVPKPPIPMAGAERRAEKAIRKVSRAFYRAMSWKPRKLPGVGDWAWFHAFKAMCSMASYQKACPADYAYYKDKKEFFYPIEGHVLRKLGGKLFGGMMKLGIGAVAGKQ